MTPAHAAIVQDHCSGDPHYSHHAAALMFQDVAVKHPVAWIVRDERDLHTFLRTHQDGVLPLLVSGGPAVTAEHPETVAVQVDWMMPLRVVDQCQEV